MKRKGLGLNLGKGYKNLVPLDPHIHSLNARGYKSSTLLNAMPGNINVEELQDVQYSDEPMAEVEVDEMVKEGKPSFFKKFGEKTKKIAKKSYEAGSRGFEIAKQKYQEHEMAKEHEAEELSKLSDSTLREKAIRYRPTSLFGSRNIYEDELVRRQRKSRLLSKELRRIDNEPEQKPLLSGLFG